MQNLPSSSKENLRAIKCIEQFGSSANFLLTFNPAKQYEYCKAVERCYCGKAPSLTTLAEAYGENIAETWLAIQLRDLSEFSGCKEKLSIQHIEQISKVIVMEFGYLKVTELMHFFVLFKSGKFGKFYGSVDGLVITEALQEFKQLRRDKLREIELQREREDRARRDAEHAKNAMCYDEWQELKWLFNMGYEPWRIKAELNEQNK